MNLRDQDRRKGLASRFSVLQKNPFCGKRCAISGGAQCRNRSSAAAPPAGLKAQSRMIEVPPSQ
jgi:hypothetical protein